VLNGVAVGAMVRYAAPKDFRANFSLSNKAKFQPLTAEIKELSAKVANHFKIDLCGIDLLETAAGLIVCEVNSAPGFRGLMSVDPKLDIPQLIFNHIVQVKG